MGGIGKLGSNWEVIERLYEPWGYGYLDVFLASHTSNLILSPYCYYMLLCLTDTSSELGWFNYSCKDDIVAAVVGVGVLCLKSSSRRCIAGWNLATATNFHQWLWFLATRLQMEICNPSCNAPVLLHIAQPQLLRSAPGSVSIGHLHTQPLIFFPHCKNFAVDYYTIIFFLLEYSKYKCLKIK